MGRRLPVFAIGLELTATPFGANGKHTQRTGGGDPLAGADMGDDTEPPF